MARRNLFQPPAPPPAQPSTAPQKDNPSRFPNTGAMSGVKSTLKDLSSNAVREIAVDAIDDDGLRDRLAFTDADVAELAESIRAHGQQVPIMVRPIAEKPGHYRIVYGRRRLRALRLVGVPAKALIRSLSDEEAVLAQGQENSQRLDPSFIEKALFAADLAANGYEQPVILDALAVDRPMLSRMLKVANAIPVPVIRLIGSAHGIGRRRWEELADLVKTHEIDLEQVVQKRDLEDVRPSDERFTRVMSTLAEAIARQENTAAGAAEASPSPTLSILLKDGTPLAEVKETARALTLKLSKAEAPEFARWMRDNAQAELTRLYEAWQSDRKPD